MNAVAETKGRVANNWQWKDGDWTILYHLDEIRHRMRRLIEDQCYRWCAGMIAGINQRPVPAKESRVKRSVSVSLSFLFYGMALVSVLVSAALYRAHSALSRGSSPSPHFYEGMLRRLLERI